MSEQSERLKYEKAWDMPKYRTQSPGERSVEHFLGLTKDGETVVDVGCGTGRASLIISKHHDISMADIAKNCLDEAVEKEIGDKLEIMCLWSDELPKADWAFCCDVMEHIPEDHVDEVLSNIARNTKKAYLRIHLGNDVFGKTYLGEPLHLTVKPHSWWLNKISNYIDVESHVQEGKTSTFMGRAK